MSQIASVESENQEILHGRLEGHQQLGSGNQRQKSHSRQKYIYLITMGPPNLYTSLEVFMVNPVFRWPTPLFFMVLARMFSCKSIRTNMKEYCLQSRSTCFGHCCFGINSTVVRHSQVCSSPRNIMPGGKVTE